MNIIDVWKTVFSERKYIFIVVGVAIIFYLLNVLILDYSTLTSYARVNGFLASAYFFLLLAYGLANTIPLGSYISLVAVSVLLGMLTSVILYKVDLGAKGQKKTGFFATIGVAIAMIAPGCAVCGFGVLPLLGIGGAFLTALPFHGLEISLLSLVLVGGTLWKVSRDLLQCKVTPLGR